MRAQGGEPDVAALPKAPLVREVFAPRPGHVQRLRALPVGVAALHLGAGRRAKDDAIDHAVGVVCLKKRGDAVDEGEPLAEIHARDEQSAAAAAASVLAAVRARRRAAALARHRARHDGLAGRWMPELPEVETVRAQLEPVLTGRRFEQVEIHDPRLGTTRRAGRGGGGARG